MGADEKERRQEKERIVATGAKRGLSTGGIYTKEMCSAQLACRTGPGKEHLARMHPTALSRCIDLVIRIDWM